MSDWSRMGRTEELTSTAFKKSAFGEPGARACAGMGRLFCMLAYGTRPAREEVRGVAERVERSNGRDAGRESPPCTERCREGQQRASAQRRRGLTAAAAELHGVFEDAAHAHHSKRAVQADGSVERLAELHARGV